MGRVRSITNEINILLREINISAMKKEKNDCKLKILNNQLGN